MGKIYGHFYQWNACQNENENETKNQNLSTVMGY